MPINMVVVVVLIVLVLTVVLGFMFTQSGTQITQTNAAQMFGQLCNSYKAEDCAWSVTKQASFSDFLEACKLFYGATYEEYTCLYKFCCGTAGADVICEAKCNICSANKKIGLDITECCRDYSNECSDVCIECVV